MSGRYRGETIPGKRFKALTGEIPAEVAVRRSHRARALKIDRHEQHDPSNIRYTVFNSSDTAISNAEASALIVRKQTSFLPSSRSET